MGKRSRASTTASRPPRHSSSSSGAVAPPSGPAPADSTNAVDGWLAAVQQEMLTATYWFDPEEHGLTGSVTILFSGRRVDRTGQPGRRDTFSQQEVVDGIIPGAGPVAVTTRVSGINAGEWLVTARPVGRSAVGKARSQASGGPRPPDAELSDRTIWPGRTPSAPYSSTSRVRTALVPLLRVPGVVRFAWPLMVGLGIIVGLAIQAVLLAHVQAQVVSGLMVSVTAVLVGGIAAKAWYVAVHKGRRYDGWCIQGFILGTSLVAAGLPLMVLSIPVGTYLDTAAPALLLGMLIGRPGCFLVGCCAGRPTASRWGLWCSDRRVAMRRIPTQLMEAIICLPIGFVALMLVLAGPPMLPGSIFVGALAAYTLARQFILPLRAEPRQTTLGPLLAAAVSALALIGVVVLAVV